MTSDAHDGTDEGPRHVAVVLAGAGARGAYEAGVLSVVLPLLAEAGRRPALYVGTSAGAVNATVLAATAELPAAEQADALLAVWRGLRTSDVVRPVLRTAPTALWRGIGQALGVPWHRLTSLLDTTPLARTAERRVSWGQLRANVGSGRTALAVVTTAVATQRTAVLVDRSSPAELPPPDDSRPIDYLAAEVGAAHVLASAAIPVLFPAVWLDRPAEARGWHLDGGVRLNAPLKPALALGADAVVVVGTHPAVHPDEELPSAAATGRPDIDDTMVQLMDAALVDRMVEDVGLLATLNELVRSGGQREAGRRQLRVVRWLFFGPEQRSTLGQLAAACFDRRYRGATGALRAVGDVDQFLLGRSLVGDGPRRGDLLSYLFFSPDFLDAAIELGQRDTTAALAGSPVGTVPWQVPAPAPGHRPGPGVG